ncbi:YitT family protein [Oceanirhabdus sp. W0125-5]|uniref:YitT family protein n=1 Tax=Oceanirhabdus sp. W0125-5 TaxID=2999116 RepID=UPI0022F30CFB|nr:YitT family protein [Oceanirhabdus sp. W0125-5]WBW98281.1 YitT family protein [Oceanirhabdus sp. W0125-5]
MDKLKCNKELKDYLLILIGTTILALGINLFLAPSTLVTGGVTGIAIMVEYLSETYLNMTIPIWLTNFAINIPLFAIAIKQRGISFGKKSLFSAIYLSFALWYTGFIPNPFAAESDLLLAAIFGGALIGVGLGFVLRASATTGGTDMLATIIKYKHNKFPISKLIMLVDSTIIIMGFFAFGARKAMYAVICVYVISKVVNSLLEGMHFAIAAFIISDKSDEIAKELIQNIKRGATGIKAKGMYTKKDKDMLFVVVSKKEIHSVRQVVKNIDEKAFITITDVREVLGEGFIEDTNVLV